jgi:hypothetical protein
MGGDQELRRGQQSMQDPNVIIPDVGAGRYWYVDPKAGLAQQPASQFAQQSAAQVYDPMADERSNQAQLKAWGEQAPIEHPSIEVMKAVQRIINQQKPDEQPAGRRLMSERELEEAMRRLGILPGSTQPSF